MNLSVTDIPGPRRPLYLGGTRLLEVFAIPPLVGNITLGVAALSYAGQLSITTVVDPTACPDLKIFDTAVRDTLEELARSIRPASRPT